MSSRDFEQKLKQQEKDGKKKENNMTGKYDRKHELSNSNVTSCASKGAKRFKQDKSDEDDITMLNRTSYDAPANLPVQGKLQYPVVKSGQTVYAMKLTIIDPWYRGTIKKIVNKDYVHIVFQTGKKIVTIKQIAYSTLNSVRFPVGCRIIANSKRDDKFYAGIVAEPPNLINNFRYLIFFDDGYVQYTQHQDIRLIARQEQFKFIWKDVAENSQDFIKSYLKNFPDRQMVNFTKIHLVQAVHQQKWQSAKVLEVDASLVKIYFFNFQHSKWIYRGSSCLKNMFDIQSKSERDIGLRYSRLRQITSDHIFEEFTSIEENTGKAIVPKSTRNNSTTTDDRTQKCNKNKANATNVVDKILPKPVHNPIKYSEHSPCNPSCVAQTSYNYDETRTMNMLSIPLHFGFARQITIINECQKNVEYTTPCGITIKNIEQMLKYLITTKSGMTIDQFEFNYWVDPLAEYKIIKSVKFLKDISEGKEFRGITCVNIINSILPPKIDYITTRRPMVGVKINVKSEFLCGCDCTDNCQDKLKCACWQLTNDGQRILPDCYKDLDIGYNYRRLPAQVATGIYECNINCKCSSSCLNRVVQNPLSQKLQLFMTEKKGWGVQCLNDIPQGSFICNYIGCIITETDSNAVAKYHGDEYFAELDYIETIEKIEEHISKDDIPSSDHAYETETNHSESSDEHYPCTSKGRRSEKPKKSKTIKDVNHVQVLSKFNICDMKKNPKPSKSIREYFGNNESAYIIDSKTSGNIGRYLNHSCSPNLFVQNVFVDTHDLRFPWVSFFALHHIKAGTELTWDYNYEKGSIPGRNMNCNCQSTLCRGRLL